MRKRKKPSSKRKLKGVPLLDEGIELAPGTTQDFHNDDGERQTVVIINNKV